MGIDLIFAELLFAEHRHRPITGEMLSISRQTIGFSEAEARQLMQETGLAARSGTQGARDADTVHQTGTDTIADHSFYGLFSDAKLTVLDVTNYERADVLHDMSMPISPELEGRFDFILCGSCLDNIFNPVTALQNLARLVKPGGRIFLSEWGEHPTAYLRFSPDWFFDYFAVNGFADCKCYLLDYPWAKRMRRLDEEASFADLYYYDPLVQNSGRWGCQCTQREKPGLYLNFVVAEKAADSTWEKNPIQLHYRADDAQKAPYLESALRFKEAARPVYRRTRENIIGDPDLSAVGTLKPVASWIDTKYRSAIPRLPARPGWGRRLRDWWRG